MVDHAPLRRNVSPNPPAVGIVILHLSSQSCLALIHPLPYRSKSNVLFLPRKCSLFLKFKTRSSSQTLTTRRVFADDIITPVYVAPTRSPTTLRPKHHKEKIQERPSCDDEEDCGEGSGEPVTTEEILVTSATDSSSVTYTTAREYTSSHISTQTSPGSPSTSTRDTVTVSGQYNVSTTDLETSDASSIVTQRSTTVTTQTTTTEMTDPPPPPLPPIHTPVPATPKNPNKNRGTEAAADGAALIIIIIAAALIAIILIILIILKFKNRPETSYKVDETKTFCQDPNAALLGATGSGQPFNGALKNGANGSKTNKKRELVDIKEWYV
ncbi:protein EVI2B-like [Hylaeus volcanicus]|uniref:protein EVI2B-like n=1 Tax=Hylaeus volcanicus TaxID=313075 RepID=UPI0023B84155|nr:protein EVI2B-like [Hylaeus volcanicus]